MLLICLQLLLKRVSLLGIESIRKQPRLKKSKVARSLLPLPFSFCSLSFILSWGSISLSSLSSLRQLTCLPFSFSFSLLILSLPLILCLSLFLLSPFLAGVNGLVYRPTVFDIGCRISAQWKANNGSAVSNMAQLGPRPSSFSSISSFIVSG